MPDGARLDATGALAAGIMFMTDDARVLLLRRSGMDHSGEWAFPGGRLEPGEDAEQAALREAFEELGDVVPEGVKLVEWMRRVQDGVDFTTFLGRVREPFVPQLNEEHDSFEWVMLRDLLEPQAEPVADDANMTPTPLATPEARTDPPVSQVQRGAMEAAAHGHSTLGIPASVGKEFAAADPGGKLPKRADDATNPSSPTVGDHIEFLDDRLTDKGPATGEVISLHDGFIGVSWGGGDTENFEWSKLTPTARRSSNHSRVTWLVGEGRQDRQDALAQIVEHIALTEIQRKVAAIVKD